MKKIIPLLKKYNILFFFLLISNSMFANDSSLVKFVNPFIGTSNGGNTFPGAVVPWGMASVSPHNLPGSPSGYTYGEKYFFGFGHTHLSGTGCSDLGNIILTATEGELKTNPEDYKSTYSSEEASPGYYKVYLNEPGLTAEVSASERGGITKFSSEKNNEINILFDLGRNLSITGGGMIKILSENEIEGYNIGGGFCGENNRQKIFFYAKFNTNPFASGVWIDEKISEEKYAEIIDTRVGGWFKFNINKNNPIIVKVGISYVNTENAKENLDNEISGWDFNLVKKKAEEKWEKNLSKIIVEGENEDKIKFYSAFYHMLIHPNIINDINGEYPLMGRNGIGKYSDRNRYTIFSLWDTYRTLHPFLTLVFPEVQSEIIKTMIDMYSESGYLPKWELAGNETYMMVGDPASIVIADSYIKGISDFNIEKAFDAVCKPALIEEGNEAPPIRAGYHELLKFGYIPFEQDLTKDWWVWGPVSTTLEYCLSDFAISQFAKKYGKAKEENLFKKRSLFYRNLFDKETNFIRPKMKDGSWLEPWDTLAVEGSGDWEGSGGPGYVEGNTWNYTFFVPHDIPGLIYLFEGEKNFSEKLEESFKNNQFTINNEPDIAYPYLFTYLKGEEEKTRFYVQKIMKENFETDHNGLPGNDDCGTISGWFIFSSLGFYPALPASEFYQAGYPLFDRIILKLNKSYYSGDSLIIERGKNPEEKSIEINGKKVENFQIEHKSVTSGGKLIIN